MVTEFVDVGTQRLRIGRSGTGPPLLLILGLGGRIEHWEPVRRLMCGHELIMVDHPGMGQSPAPGAPMPMHSLASLYDDLMDRLGYQQVDVLGYSFGGGVTQQLAVQHPGRVHRIVLAATACGWGGVPMTFSAMLVSGSPMRYYSQAFRESIAPYMYGGSTGREPKRLAGVALPRPSIQGLMYQIAAYSTWTSLPWLHRLRQPVLVLVGEEDPMAPPGNSVILANRIPGATLRVFPRAGHLFLFDETASVVPVIQDFLAPEPVPEAV